ncbi:hypothetical protein BJV82DRAFT_674787 [Fennellomyces sp. T-0311]|nr:hypothetical protein BJV82DRAFT_674787 [Fennellomyces sp. T-0311]
MGFLRRGNKKGLRKDQVSTMTSSFSSPEPLHLKISDSLPENNNIHGSPIASAFMSSTEPTNGVLNGSATSPPTSLIDDILFELRSSEAKKPESPSLPIIPGNARYQSTLSDTVQTTEINSSAAEHIWKNQGTASTATPAATLTKCARRNTATDYVVHRHHSVNSGPGDSSSRIPSIDVSSMRREKPAFKRKNGSIPDSDVSDTETSSTSSTVISSESESAAHTKQQDPTGSNSKFNKTGSSGPSSPVSSQAILMARMKERHRQECRKSWQAIPENLYIHRASPSMPVIYPLDTIIPSSAVPTSESFMSLAPSPRLSGSEQYSKQQHQQQTVYRPRLAQPLSMPYALDLASRGFVDVTSPYGNSTMSEPPLSPKQEGYNMGYHQEPGVKQKLDRPLSTPVSLWPSEQRKKRASTPPSTRNAASPTMTAHQRRFQQQQKLAPSIHMPLTPPPDDMPVSPKAAQHFIPETVNMEKLPRKLISELERMHDGHSRYSLPDLSDLESPGPSNRRLLKRVSRSMTDLKDSSRKVTGEKQRAPVDTITRNQGAEISPPTNAGYQQLLPLGDTMPVVLVVKGTPDQYYLVMQQQGHHALHCHQQHHHQPHHNACGHIMQHLACSQSYNQVSSCVHHHQHNACQHGPPSCSTENTCSPGSATSQVSSPSPANFLCNPQGEGALPASTPQPPLSPSPSLSYSPPQVRVCDVVLLY